MNIYIRLNCSSIIGIGHIVRASRISKEFEKINFECFFFLDFKDYKYDKIIKKILNKNFFYLYSNKNYSFSQLNDAKLFIDKLYKFKLDPGYVIIDDYRVGLQWQKKVSKYQKKIICFDDMENRKHFADYIINYNPRNYPVINYKYSNNKKKNAIYLIHPKFNVISSTSKPVPNKNNKFNITFYIGGGGDLKLISDLLEVSTRMINATSVRFNVIIGPFSKNKNLIKKVSKKDQRIIPIENNFDLDSIIATSSIFISSSGTGIFESAAAGVTTILFKSAKNQDSDILGLENLSHYFFIDKKDLARKIDFNTLLKSIVINYNRIKLLKNNPKINIDNFGAKRIVSMIAKPPRSSYQKINQIYGASNNILKIRKVIDRDINHYLISRNLKINRDNSLSKIKITTLDHYNWWFKNNRLSYLLKNGNKKVLYFYEDNAFKLKKINYKISGWFACSSECSIKEILFALNWQRKKTKNNFVWLSFINKHNKMSQQLSKYVDWKEISPNHEVSIKMQKYYKLERNKYIYYIR